MSTIWGFHLHHKQHLCEIAWLPRFSRDIQPSVSEKTGKGESASVWEMLKLFEDDDDLMEENASPEDQQEAEEEEAEEAKEELVQHLTSVLTISHASAKPVRAVRIYVELHRGYRAIEAPRDICCL